MDLKTTYENPKIHESWESTYRGDPLQDRFNDRITDRVIDLLQIPADGHVLDAGCGIGAYSQRIARRGYDVTGVDISEHILDAARHSAAANGLADRCTFLDRKLEELDFPDGTFDAIHCRGVLMHIPEWEWALAELCRVLKPGGRIAILEENHAAVEPKVVNLVRMVRRSKSRAVKTPGGVEFWAEVDGEPFVARHANIRYLIDWLRSRGFGEFHRFSTEFWGPSRFPAGLARDAVTQFNRLYFALGGPAALGVGNAIVARKAAS